MVSRIIFSFQTGAKNKSSIYFKISNLTLTLHIYKETPLCFFLWSTLVCLLGTLRQCAFIIRHTTWVFVIITDHGLANNISAVTQAVVRVIYLSVCFGLKCDNMTYLWKKIERITDPEIQAIQSHFKVWPQLLNLYDLWPYMHHHGHHSRHSL